MNTTKLNLWSTNFSSIYSELSDLEQKVFDFINKSQEEGVSKPIIEERFDLSDHDTRNLLNKMRELKLIERIGKSSLSRYRVLKPSLQELIESKQIINDIY